MRRASRFPPRCGVARRSTSGRRPPEPRFTAPRRAGPNILLLGIDTLRADRLGSWGREPSLSPSIDRLAEQSDVWLDAFTVFNATNPSFASMMTGLYAQEPWRL